MPLQTLDAIIEVIDNGIAEHEAAISNLRGAREALKPTRQPRRKPAKKARKRRSDAGKPRQKHTAPPPAKADEPDEHRVGMVEGSLKVQGQATVPQIAQHTKLPEPAVDGIVSMLAANGVAQVDDDGVWVLTDGS